MVTKEETIWTYDDTYDILYVNILQDVDYAISEESGNLVIDYTDGDTVMGIRLMDASQEMGLNKEVLQNIKGIACNVQKEEKSLSVTLTLSIKNGTRDEVHTQHITAPLQHKEASATH